MRRYRSYLARLVLALIFSSLALLLGLGSGAGAGEGEGLPAITVCPSGCDFTTIQEAVAAAPAGATIRVGAGVYKESLVIEKALTIVGIGSDGSDIAEDGTRIVGEAPGRPVILVQGEAEVRLEGLVLTGARGYCYCWPVCADGLLVRGSARVTLARSVVSGSGWGGVVALDEAQLLLEEVLLWGNHRSQLSLRGQARAGVRGSRFLQGDDAGIALWEQARATIRGSEITGNRFYGIVLHDSAQAGLEESLIEGNRGDGVALQDTAQAVLLANTIRANIGAGVELRDGAQASLIRNRITENRGDGVVLWMGVEATITKNTVVANRNGLLLGMNLPGITPAAATASGTLRLRENVVRESRGWGIVIFSAECGFAGALGPPELALIGEGNEVVANERGDLCPGSADYPWPEGFLAGGEAATDGTGEGLGLGLASQEGA